MYAGRIAEENDVVTLLRSPRHRYARALINSTPIMGETRRFSTIPGQAPSAGAAPPGCAFAPRCSAAVEACRSTPPPFGAFRGGRFACHNPEEPWEISA
jgi:oligopeptide/dipeptide ABC transporter ATP-binding protein